MKFSDILETQGLFDASSIVWPLSFILIALILLRQLRDDVHPIFVGMVGSLAKQSSNNAVAWAVGIMMGLLGSLEALGEVAQQMHWLYLAAFAKVLQPGLAAIVSYIMASPSQKPPAPLSSISNPPFPPNPPNEK